MSNPARAPDAAPPLKDGRYRLVEIIGKGGMAIVYLAYDTHLRIWRAIKVLNPTLAASSVLRERFQREARTMARIKHPNVVSVHDSLKDGDRYFIVMELLPGKSLQHHATKRGPLPPRQTATVMAELLRGLTAVHHAGVVHRDIKPFNVLVDTDGTPKLGDFGIVHLDVEEDSNLTRSGAAVGTWAFMAPEQRRNSREVDHHADIYAVGATIFALLTCNEPHDLDRPDVHADTLEGVPGPLREIIARATRFKPSDRYGSAEEMRVALLEAIEALPPDPPGCGFPTMLPPPEAPPPDEAGRELAEPERSPVVPLPPVNEFTPGHNTVVPVTDDPSSIPGVDTSFRATGIFGKRPGRVGLILGLLMLSVAVLWMFRTDDQEAVSAVGGDPPPVEKVPVQPTGPPNPPVEVVSPGQGNTLTDAADNGSDTATRAPKGRIKGATATDVNNKPGPVGTVAATPETPTTMGKVHVLAEGGTCRLSLDGATISFVADKGGVNVPIATGTHWLGCQAAPRTLDRRIDVVANDLTPICFNSVTGGQCIGAGS